MPHEDQIKQAYEAFNTGDEATLRGALEGLLHDDVVWHDETHESPPTTGKQDVIEVLVGMLANRPVELIGVRASGDVALTLDSGPGDGRPHLCADRVVFQGNRITEIWYCDAHSDQPRHR